MKLIDTNVLIDNLKKGIYEEGAISIITLIEVLRGVPDKKRDKVKLLLEKSFDVLNIDNNTVLKYCELYTALKQTGKLISDADLLIASMAISNNLPLVTKDKDFKRLKELGLKLELRSK
ncbi:MAG: type II toxin-antitoxin system VapC family toxin [Thermoprotei archaeon]|nr:MAG: type II toxin-antitoxin system VapC family toxin [Thermoprotei archaeon]